MFTTLCLVATVAASHAQSYEFALNWRAIGTTVVFNDRAGFSSGPVAGVWFDPDGQALEVQLENGRIFRTTDFENWTSAARPGNRAVSETRALNGAPEGVRVAFAPGRPYRAYAAGRWLYRSDDGGKHWTNIVTSNNTQLIGENVRTLAVSPFDPDRLAVVTNEGLWWSADGGDTWVSLNPGLPNLRLTRLLAAPQAGRGVLAQWEGSKVVEWLPGARGAWMAHDEMVATREALRWTDAGNTGLRLEVRSADRARLYRSLNAGLQWDDLTSDLPAQQIFGIAAERSSGAIYVATERGVYYTLNNLEIASAPTSWIRLGGNLPREAALDVMLNEGGNFLYVSLAGEGVFLTHAPHRRRSPALVSSADLVSKAAAPGGLMSVVGVRLTDAQLGGRKVPILSANTDETQIQIPYDAVWPSPALELGAAAGAFRLDLELAETAPAIFTDRDGAPLLLDAESGELLDPTVPLRAGMRVQVLLTGLGRVEPSWPAGIAAPAANPPRVVAPVRVWFNDQTLEVSKAELAAGYVGFYAVETKLPPVLDSGFASLRVEAAGRNSNTIQIRTTLD